MIIGDLIKHLSFVDSDFMAINLFLRLLVGWTVDQRRFDGCIFLLLLLYLHILKSNMYLYFL